MINKLKKIPLLEEMNSFDWHDAIVKNATRQMKQEIDNGWDFNTKDNNGFTPLHYAVGYYAKGGIIDLLLQEGADVNTQATWDKTPLITAVERGLEDVVEKLINAGADVNIAANAGYTALYYASDSTSRRDINPNIIKLLVDAGADVDAQTDSGNTALHNAVKLSADAVRILLSANADPNIKNNDGKTPLNSTSYYKGEDTGIAKMLVDAGAEFVLSNIGDHPIHDAVDVNQIDMVKFYVQAGVDINIRDAKQATPLHRSMDAEVPEIAKYLIDNGADVNATDMNNATPVHYGVVANMLEPVELMIKKDADINIRDDKGYTPIDAAVITKNKDMINLLVQSGADINSADKKTGKTPIYYAAHHNSEFLQLVIDLGANPDVVTNKDETLFDAVNASMNYDTEKERMKKILKQAGLIE